MQIREDRFIVNTSDCRPDGTIKLNALMQYLQEAAARHAEQLGFGFADLDRLGCFWVLANLRIEILAMPRWRDSMVIRTWPSGRTRLMASREFIGSTPESGEIFRASTEWMILDRQSGRPRNLSRMELRLPQAATKAMDAELRRLQPMADYTTAWTLRVPFSALDFNSHVNNTEYVRWALDGLHSAMPELPAVRSVQMTFLAEAFAGDRIEVVVAAEDDARIYVLERRTDGDSPANLFLMVLEGP